MIELLTRFLKRHSVQWKFFRSLNGSAKVLDLGCGSGRNGIEIKTIHSGAELYGVDIVSTPDLPNYYSFKIADLDKDVLPYPDEFFDAVLFTHVIEHLRQPLQLGKEINRVMKTNARIYLDTPNWSTVFVPSFGFHQEQHSPFNFFDDPTHVKPWSKHGLFEFLLQACNLKVIRVGTVRNWIRIPFDFAIILYGFVRGLRPPIVSSFWNLYGWCIYGIGVKA